MTPEQNGLRYRREPVLPRRLTPDAGPVVIGPQPRTHTRRTPLLARGLWLLLAVLSLALVTSRSVAAQTRADSAAVLLEAARRFEDAGRLEVADALYDDILDRFGDTPAAAEVRRLRAVRPRAAGERSGRAELQVWSTLYGAWLGVAIPLMFEADSPEPYGLGLLLGTPAGFLGSRAYARSHQLTEGQARAITFGGTWGTWQGLGWAVALDIGSDGDAVDEYITAMVASGLAGIGVGAYLARKPIAAGTATAVNFGAFWGTWFGLALGVLADREDELLEASLLGGNALLVTTAILAPRWQVSRPRARLVSIAGVLGGIAGAGVSLLAQPDDEKVAILFPLAGSVAGLWIGAATTRGEDRTGASGGEDAGALLEVRAGRIGLGTPLPRVTMLRIERDGRRAWQPAAALTLLHARF